MLASTLTRRGVNQWLETGNRLLGGESPVSGPARNEIVRVRAAAAAFVEGDYV